MCQFVHYTFVLRYNATISIMRLFVLLYFCADVQCSNQYNAAACSIMILCNNNVYFGDGFIDDAC